MIIKTVTFYKNSKDVIGTTDVGLNSILNLIKTGDYGLSQIILNLRSLLNNEDIDGYREMKREQLPMFAASGNFTYRNSDLNNLKDYSNIVIVDLDWQQPDPLVIQGYKDYFIQNADSFHLYAVWLSPGHGIKCAIVHDSNQPEYHYNLVMQIRHDLFNDNPAFDTSCTNIDRTCFLSYDPELWINPHDFPPYHFIPNPTISKPAKTSSSNRMNGSRFQHTQQQIEDNHRYQSICTDKTLMNRLIKIFNQKNPDYYKDGNRHNEVKKRAVLYCRDGILYENAVWSLKGQFGEKSKASLKDQDIESMVSSCYKKASDEFGVDRLKFTTPGNTPFQNPSMP